MVCLYKEILISHERNGPLINETIQINLKKHYGTCKIPGTIMLTSYINGSIYNKFQTRQTYVLEPDQYLLAVGALRADNYITLHICQNLLNYTLKF
jgi:hypothetical protein